MQNPKNDPNLLIVLGLWQHWWFTMVPGYADPPNVQICVEGRLRGATEGLKRIRVYVLP
jgi:hypothetical protein